MTERPIEPDDDRDAFDRQHENCPAHWICQSCEERVCPRCDPSPGEVVQLCHECWWNEDPEEAA